MDIHTSFFIFFHFSFPCFERFPKRRVYFHMEKKAIRKEEKDYRRLLHCCSLNDKFKGTLEHCAFLNKISFIELLKDCHVQN